jgi:hypothetical protein
MANECLLDNFMAVSKYYRMGTSTHADLIQKLIRDARYKLPCSVVYLRPCRLPISDIPAYVIGHKLGSYITLSYTQHL